MLLLAAPWPTGYVLDVYIGNLNFIWILLVVEMLVFRGKRAESTVALEWDTLTEF